VLVREFFRPGHGPLARALGADIVQADFVHAGLRTASPERESRRSCRRSSRSRTLPDFQEHKEWGRILGVNTVGRLNENHRHKEISDFIKIAEAFHEKKIGRSPTISRTSGQLKWALIAGIFLG